MYRIVLGCYQSFCDFFFFFCVGFLVAYYRSCSLPVYFRNDLLSCYFIIAKKCLSLKTTLAILSSAIDIISSCVGWSVSLWNVCISQSSPILEHWDSVLAANGEQTHKSSWMVAVSGNRVHLFPDFDGNQLVTKHRYAQHRPAQIPLKRLLYWLKIGSHQLSVLRFKWLATHTHGPVDGPVGRVISSRSVSTVQWPLLGLDTIYLDIRLSTDQIYRKRFVNPRIVKCIQLESPRYSNILEITFNSRWSFYYLSIYYSLN